MELKGFIKLALTEVCDGIAEARTEIEAKYKGNCIIAPANLDGKKAYKNTSEISFDLAICLEEEKGNIKNGGVGLKVMSAGISSENKISEKKVNRITFSVPFIPQGLRKTKDH